MCVFKKLYTLKNINCNGEKLPVGNPHLIGIYFNYITSNYFNGN